jgi:hypothetical protein
MGNGANEAVQFTREDADRITRVENDVCHIKKHLSRLLTLGYAAASVIIATGLTAIGKMLYNM